MTVVAGHTARQVADRIVDAAVNSSFDCTGVVDEFGVHGIGKGHPPCTKLLSFKKIFCPADSHGPPSMLDESECRCNTGYTGPDGGPCSACGEGTYKAVWGNESCSACPANSAHAVTASVTATDCECAPAWHGPNGDTPATHFAHTCWSRAPFAYMLV